MDRDVEGRQGLSYSCGGDSVSDDFPQEGGYAKAYATTTCPHCQCKFRPVFAKEIDGELVIDTGKIRGSRFHSYKVVEVLE